MNGHIQTQSMPQSVRVVLHFGDDGIWWVESPDVKGCYSQGDTQQEAVENMKEALQTHFASSAGSRSKKNFELRGEVELSLVA